MRGRWLFAVKVALILGAAGYVYSPALRGGWLWDDDVQITSNRLVQDPAGLGRIWLASTNFDYYPITASVEWLQWRLWGTDTLGYHLTNLCLHACAAFLLWRVLRKLNVPGAWAGGLIWALHPLAVESVAWISELKNTLSLPPLLMAAAAYIDFDRDRRRGHYVQALLGFLVAMLCKSSVVVLPLILLLHAGWKRGRVTLGDLRAAAPFLVVALVLGCVTLGFQEQRTVIGTTEADGGWISRAAAAMWALGFYSGKCVWPFDLMPVYPPRGGVYWPWLADAALLLLAVGSWVRRRTWGRTVLFGLGCFVLFLAPILGLLPMAFLRISPVSDHLGYLALAVASGLAAAGMGVAWRKASIGFRPWIVLAAGAGCVAFASAGHRYASVFRSEETLWDYGVARNPGTWLGQYNLAVVLRDTGRLEEAVARYQEAVRIKPAYPEAQCNLAVCLEKLGREAEAIPHYEEAVRIQTNYVFARTALGLAYAREGRTADAIDQYREALKANPGYYEAENNWGNALLDAGSAAEAAEHFERAEKLQPDLADIHYNWGLALAAMGRHRDAAAEFQRTLTLNPAYAFAYFRLGLESVAAGRFDEAAGDYRNALRLKPDFPEAEDNLGVALANSGKLAEAVPHFESAARLRPGYIKAHEDLALAFRSLGRADEARAQAEEAARLKSAQGNLGRKGVHE